MNLKITNSNQILSEILKDLSSQFNNIVIFLNPNDCITIKYLTENIQYQSIIWSLKYHTISISTKEDSVCNHISIQHREILKEIINDYITFVKTKKTNFNISHCKSNDKSIYAFNYKNETIIQSRFIKNRYSFIEKMITLAQKKPNLKNSILLFEYKIKDQKMEDLINFVQMYAIKYTIKEDFFNPDMNIQSLDIGFQNI